MNMMGEPRVEQFMADIQAATPQWYEIASAVRKAFREHESVVTEDIKYGGVVFLLDQVLIGGVYFYKNHCSLEISNGAELKNPDGFLEGNGKFRRHIKMTTLADINNKNVSDYIQQSINNIRSSPQ